jgi:hypothetical protein
MSQPPSPTMPASTPCPCTSGAEVPPSPPPSPGASGSDGAGSCPPPPPPACVGRPPKRQCLENGKWCCPVGGCCKEMSPKSAAQHERIHTGERPFKCDVPGCGDSFTTSIGLTRHKMLHNNDRPFVCTAVDCEARFVQLGNLKMHVERNHTERAHQRTKKA